MAAVCHSAIVVPADGRRTFLRGRAAAGGVSSTEKLDRLREVGARKSGIESGNLKPVR